MKLSLIFIFVIAMVFALSGRAESKNIFKRLEKVGKNIRNAAERSLPTVLGYAAVAGAVGKK
ncbi:cecropin-B-like [Anoplophora glabripennis]|uniref:cecropin-B-like n=1 Tax=Anoplophora glabripennis TaxID=217634 RepID=UPI0008754A5E|nr:cecropin-B-like [Anoplophora glabripennis]